VERAEPHAGRRLSIAVVIPSYRRPDELTRCLVALADQTRAPDQIVVVVRRSDELTIERCEGLSRRLAIDVVAVDRAGQVAALNAGLARVRTTVVAFTDDDCQPHPEWIARLCAHFLGDARVGAVGGRDIVHEKGTPVAVPTRAVGRITRFGRLHGNHHKISDQQDVQFLKGANMAYRREILHGFDDRLRGDGAQVHNDLKASLEVWSAGHRIVWDPAVIVDHYPAPRADEARGRESLASLRKAHHNEVYTLMSIRPRRVSLVAVMYCFIVGTRTAPGLLLLPYLLLTRSHPRPGLRFLVALFGRLDGLATAARSRNAP
jgi:glycosyltransferase involved in cell wall biosynthesis